MKIAHRVRRVQYISSNEKITSFAGLKLLTDMAHRLGIVRDLEERVRVKKRRRGIPVADFVLSIAQTMIAGGSSFSDLSVLRGERGTRHLLYDLETPAPTTAGERLRTFTLGHIRQLESVNARAIQRLVERAGLGGPITLDVDSSLFEVHGYLKEGVRYGYEGKKGFHPLLAFWAEERLLVGTRLRSGNRHTADGVLSFLSEARGRLPKDARVRLRLDAGFYDQKIARYAEKHDLEFSISAHQTSALVRRIGACAEDSWCPYPWQEETEWTEFPYQPDGWPRSYRMLVKRQPFYRGAQRVLGEFFYTCVLTNRSGAGSSLLKHHLARGGIENYIEEFKNGFGARTLPSQKFLANWAWLTIAQLAYNLVQAFKILVLPRKERAAQIKALRFHWFCVAARIIRSARRMTLALARAPDIAARFVQAQAILHATR